VRINPRNPHAAAREKKPVETVRRINRRWIVHGGLRESAAAYLAELEKSDTTRLRRSCQLAMDLVHTQAGHADPKPWFYAGLFALADADEAKRYLGAHPLTRLVWEKLNGIPSHDENPESLHALSCQIAEAIRGK
jgi:hypothetical protein